jgi:glycosyltransferase involved in cell wall biosynthesis
MMARIVGIIDVNSLVKPSIPMSFKRHSDYAEELRIINPKNQLAIYSNSLEIPEHDLKSLKFYPLGNRCQSKLWFLASTFKVVKREPPALMIAGDPWTGLVFAFLISLTHLPRIPIQVQLHTDVSDPNWYRASLKNRFKRMICKLLLRAADEIRFVTQSQKDLVFQDFHLKEFRGFVAAVPLNLSESVPLRENPVDINSVGFIGRIESDRGLEVLLLILQELNNSTEPPKLILVGDGKKKNYLIEQVHHLAPRIKVVQTGFLEGTEMETAWRQIGVLLSTAPSESYGRTIRESLIHGVPVIALRSNGANQLSKSIPSPYLQIFDQNSISKFNEILRVSQKTLVPKEIAAQLVSESKDNRRKVALSWDAWLGF